MIPLADARALIVENIQPREATALPLAQTLGLVLAEDALAPEDMPAFDRSAMDGYAVALDDDSERFAVVAEIQPGAMPPVVLERGQCARIFTGAAIPGGASQVVMQEDVRREGDWMMPDRRDRRTNIRLRGEDARRGAALVSAGRRLHAGELALLAQTGLTMPRVVPPARVIHFATGNELVDPSLTPGRGQIRDTNSTLIAALLAESGAQLAHQARCADDLQGTIRAVRAVPQDAWDVLLMSGGGSVGDYDFGARALEALGFTIHFTRVNLRPGKPLIFATRERQAAFIIPGNPVSHFVCYHVAIALALERLAGAAAGWPLVEVELAEDFPASADLRETYCPARVFIDEGRLRVRPLVWQSSGDLCALAGANALLQVLPDAAAIPRGGVGRCLLCTPRSGGVPPPT